MDNYTLVAKMMRKQIENPETDPEKTVQNVLEKEAGVKNIQEKPRRKEVKKANEPPLDYLREWEHKREEQEEKVQKLQKK